MYTRANVLAGQYDITEIHRRAGTPGLHTIGERVTAFSRETLLPPDLFVCVLLNSLFDWSRC